ncbi:hypothetical protein [Ferruginivarius sediminum]|uniref:hypothetical protein n=1 Tax=Ferruginivarius sediminum TaxID=2661937 RepID=UPI00187B949D|nr:hypothetical protein [Ferruginivarius sediminum]
MRERLAQVLTGLAVVCLALTVFLGGLGFLIAAGYLALAEVLPPAAAAALTGLGALLLAVLLLVVARAVMLPRRHRASPTEAETGEAKTGRASSGLGAALVPLLRENLALTIGSVFAAGVILGVSPRARRTLWNIIERQL